MKDELITFPTAKLAKEKGFNEDCYEHYHIREDDTVLADNEAGYLECTNLEDYLHSNESLRDNEYSAPTQSLLQRWLRENHSIHILMNVGMNDGTKQTFYCNVCLFGKNLYKSTFRSKISVYTYEEALEIGLFQALLLIKC